MKIIIIIFLCFFSFSFVSTVNALKPSQELVKIMTQKFYIKSNEGEKKIISRAEAIELAMNGTEVYTTSSNGNDILLRHGSPELHQVILDNDKLNYFNDLSKRLYGR